jgi:hypothetical protein
MNALISDKDVTILLTGVCEPFSLELRSDGILHSHTSSNLDFTINSLKKFNVLMGEMVNHQKVPLLITLDEFAIPPLETRVFWAKKESCPYASADAYVATNFGHKLIGNFYLKFNKPGRPTKIFATKEEAVFWLKTFL